MSSIRRPNFALLTLISMILLLPAYAAESAPSTLEDAAAFLQRAEAEFLEVAIEAETAAWVQQNFITDDTDQLASLAEQRMIETTVRLAKESVRFESLVLPVDMKRKMERLKLMLSKPAPDDAAKRRRLSEVTTALGSRYARGEYCNEAGECHSLGALSDTIASSRDPKVLLDVWTGWRTIAAPMRDEYMTFVDLGNEGARELGFTDLGSMWRSKYDMPPDAFAAETDRLWDQVRPLYEPLHCYVRTKLNEHYGDAVVPNNGPIPAHLLGNMWAQSWGNIWDIVAPVEAGSSIDLTSLLVEKGYDARKMVKTAEAFFISLGLDPLPETFWERSLFETPRDRDAVCHASAWDVDWDQDLRIKMCIKVDAEDFTTVHHELGHNYYQRAYRKLSPLYRDSAHDGFHEGLGDTLALSITPEYLQQIGLLTDVPGSEGDLSLLLQQALEKVAFLPFGLMVDRWRWGVFSGEYPADKMNAAWWELREKYQGVKAPVSRSEADFDPGAKYHVPFNTPYTRYFLAHILQFQFHRALCEEAGWEGPLHRCSIYGNKEAGARLDAMMQMGQSRPWPDALEALTGERSMDASAILDYFKPLITWLETQNKGQTCGW